MKNKPIKTDKTRVSCEGSGEAHGHPKIYLEIGEDGTVTCPYCSQKFVFKK